MSYKRKLAARDIRSINTNKYALATEALTIQTLTHKISLQEASTLVLPKKEIAKIILCAAPLLIALVIGSYLEATQHWVIPVAERVMRLGA